MARHRDHMSTKQMEAMRRLRHGYETARATSKPGEGKRFAALEKSIAAGGRARDAGAITSSIGRAKYGKKRFAAMAAAGRKRKRRGK